MANSTAVSPQEKFEAAVRVIQSLPKNGSFQPSHEMMLRFYALYKQANFGPCTDPKPAFWDVVRKAKWDAWQKLKDLSPEAAMMLYVEELKKVIETMPHTPDVSAFLEKLGSFYELVDEEEDIPNGVSEVHDGQPMKIRDSIKLAASKMNRSRGNSENYANGDHIPTVQVNEELSANGTESELVTSKQKTDDFIIFTDGTADHVRNGITSFVKEKKENGHTRGVATGAGQPDYDSSDGDDDSDEFCDVASSYSLASAPRSGLVNTDNSAAVSKLATDSSSTNISTQILQSLSRLERDVHALSARLDSMDRQLRSHIDLRPTAQVRQGDSGSGGGDGPPRRPWWWRITFDRLALRNVVFIVFWPIVVQIIGRFIVRRLRAKTTRRVRA